MKKLKYGRLLIERENILEYMGLSSDTHLEFKEDDNGDLEIKVVASEANEHEWLSKDFKGKWYSLRRFLMAFRKYVPHTGVVYKVYQNGELSGVIEGEESDAMKFFNESEGNVVLVKEELIGYKEVINTFSQ